MQNNFWSWSRSARKQPSQRKRSNRRQSSKARRRALMLEQFEDRLTLSTFTVTNIGDNGGFNPAPFAGSGTLRQAIVDANTHAGPDVIDFAISGVGIHTIGV